MKKLRVHDSPFGTYTFNETDKGISEISFTDKKANAKSAIDFANPKAYKVDVQGTPFQKKVWKALTKIKRGHTKTYAEVAIMIQKPTAVRAVASAIAQNKIALLIPCHRVIRTDGKIGKFRWGTELKRKLLQSEGVQV